MVVLISGYKRSGKDYVANILAERLGWNRMAFAEPLKDIIATTLNVSLDELEEHKNNEEVLFTIGGKLTHYDPKPVTNFRKLLQVFGTEAMKKHFGDDVWVNLLNDKIDGDVIVSDWRFIREYEVLSQKHQVMTVRILGDGVNDDAHVSERELEGFDFDFVIDNRGKSEAVLIDIANLRHYMCIR